MQKKQTSKPSAEETLVQVVVSGVPQTLLAVIDADAKHANRTRAGQIRHMLSERIAGRRELQAA